MLIRLIEDVLRFEALDREAFRSFVARLAARRGVERLSTSLGVKFGFHRRRLVVTYTRHGVVYVRGKIAAQSYRKWCMLLRFGPYRLPTPYIRYEAGSHSRLLESWPSEQGEAVPLRIDLARLATLLDDTWLVSPPRVRQDAYTYVYVRERRPGARVTTVATICDYGYFMASSASGYSAQFRERLRPFVVAALVRGV